MKNKIASNTRIKALSTKIKEKSVTIIQVEEDKRNIEYQCFREEIGIGWYYKSIPARMEARKRIKWNIAMALLYNNIEEENLKYYADYMKEYKYAYPPIYLNGLYGEHKKIIMKNIHFANNYIYKATWQGIRVYEAYVKYKKF